MQIPVNLDFDITWSDNCQKIFFTETTGAYSSDNTGGWGTPNPATSTASGASLDIIFAGASVYSNSSLYPTFPNTDGTKLTLTPSDFSQSSLVDGLYYATYTVTGNSSGAYTISKSKYVLITCSINCCLKNMASKVKCCSCNSTTQAWIEASAMYDAMWDAFNCGKYNKATEIFSYLQDYCNKNSCGCNG